MNGEYRAVGKVNELRALIRTQSLRVLLWLSKRHRVCGIDVAVVASGHDEAPLLDKISGAISLIAEVDPRRYKRITADLDVIVCIRAVYALGQYNRRLRACILDLDYVARTTSPAQIAIVIVHEALHARLHRAGVPFSEHRAERFEQACIRAELDFAKKIRGGEQLVEWVQQRLALHS